MNRATSGRAMRPLCYHCAARDPASPRACACLPCTALMTCNGTTEP
jgi:hypothetical protein